MTAQLALGEADLGRWPDVYRHLVAAVGEGLCPVHRLPLTPEGTPPMRIIGHCARCRRFWGLNLDTGDAGYWTDWNPAHPGWYRVPVPDWIGWGMP